MLTRFFKTLMLFVALTFLLQTNAQIITTVAGNGAYIDSGDGGLAINAAIGRPQDVDFDVSGSMYITDEGNGVIRKVDAVTGIITTVAGNGTKGYGGDNGPAINAELNYPYSSAIDSAGNIYISDAINYRIRKVDAKTGIITTIAGTGVWGSSGDGGLAINAQISVPLGISLNIAGTILYIADGTNNKIRKVDLNSGIISTIAGTGVRGYNGDGILATNAYLYAPDAITVDSSGNIYFTDDYNYRLRKIYASTGIITTICGNGTEGYSGDRGLATNAQIDQSDGLFFDKNGNLFLSQSVNHVIREIRASDSIIITIAGNGIPGFYGDGGYATDASLKYPGGITIDTKGNYFIADHDNSRIRKVTSGTLAVSFLKFNAQLQNNDAVLTWKTTQEINTDYFNIQRSYDGVHFTTINKILAAGNSISIKEYTYTDINVAALKQSKLYYRLEEADKDGKNNYSNLQLINLTINRLFAIAPNPANNFITVTVPSSSTASDIFIYTVDGKKVLHQSVAANSTSTQINIGALTAGVYNVVLVQDGKKGVVKMVKKM